MASRTKSKIAKAGKTAFVLSGGGRLGSVQVGMLKALFEHGICPDFCVGTSVGAINAAYICGNPTLEGIAELERIWLSVRRRDVLPVGFIKSIARMVWGRNHLISPDGLRKLLKTNLNYNTFADAVIPCFLMSTDILTGEQIVITSGSIVEAVLASAALPGIFPPVVLGGRTLVDGGISSNTPISAAIENGAKVVFIFPAGYPKVLNKIPRNIIGMMSHSLNILIGQQFMRDIEIYRRDARIHIIPPVILNRQVPNNLSRTGELLKLSYENTKQWINNGGMDSFTIPGRLMIQNQWL